MAESYGTCLSYLSNVILLLPKEERYTFRDQLIRSSISIPSNIAEGSSRESRKNFNRFLRIALGSSFELETQMLLLEQNKIINSEDLKIAKGFNEEVQKMLQTLLKKQI